MILYRENPKDSIKKLLELINEFSKAAGYKIIIQKSVVCLYTNNEHQRGKLRKTIPFTNGSKKTLQQPRNKFKQGCKRPVLGKL